ncbi:MobC family plasmid mobilization relaxosome protein [Kitasatospora purpeofusca]|uniref:MobC family plasmid mobilization relaxosome protein n=1 Tax=Kitasatospora purpeofusca TaxID=67352 RepID=UPI0035D7E18A
MTAAGQDSTTQARENDPNNAPGGASCGVSDAYPARAPKGARASRISADPGGPSESREAGPGEPAGADAPTASGPERAASRRRRPRQATQRRTCVSLRFSEAEWAAVRKAADRTDLAPGGFSAAAVLAAATSTDPNAAVADHRRGIQELMESNRQLGAVGNNLNQVAHFLNAGGRPAADLRNLLERIEASIGAVDDAVAWMVRR